MRQFQNSDREISKAAILGLLTLVSNSILHLLVPDNLIPYGNIFLFAASMSLGVMPGLVATATGIIPETLFTGEHLYGLRMVILSVALGYYGQHKPRIPGYMITASLWLVLFAPSLAYLGSRRAITLAGDMNTNLYLGMIDVLLTMITGTALMNTRVWGLLAERPRHVPLGVLLTHILTIVSTLCVFFTLSVAQILSGSPVVTSSISLGEIAWLGWLFLLCIVMPGILAERVAKVLTNQFRDNGLLNPTSGHSFSGLSSDHWRRVSSSSIARMADEINERKENSSTPSAKPLLLPATSGILAINKNRTITFANRAFHKLAGVQTNEIAGKDLKAIVMNKDICETIVHVAERAFEKGKASSELKRSNADSGLQFLEIGATKHEGHESSAISGPDSVIVTIKDITDKRTVESEALQAHKKGSLGSIVPGVAHEFNNALTSISAEASVARDSEDIKALRTSLTQILDHCKRAGGVVNQLLTFAHAEPGEDRSFDVHSWVSERLPLFKNIVGERCEIEYFYQETQSGFEVRCDPSLFMQAITNLALNSREAYGSKGGKISISISKEDIDEALAGMHAGMKAGSYVRVKIQDTGAGLSPEALEMAFNGNTTSKSNNSSRAQGLSIVFAIVRAADGFMNAESHPERGTTVSVYLPLFEEKADRSSGLEVRESASKDTDPLPNGDAPIETIITEIEEEESLMGNNERVLVVEDDTNVRDLVVTMLSTLGYEVSPCRDGEEALEMLSQHTFDVMLVDMVMPKMQGYELIDRAKDVSNVVPVVMTGYGHTRETSIRKLNVIQKPFDIDTLAVAIREALNPPADSSKDGETKTSTGLSRHTLH